MKQMLCSNIQEHIVFPKNITLGKVVHIGAELAIQILPNTFFKTKQFTSFIDISDLKK